MFVVVLLYVFLLLVRFVLFYSSAAAILINAHETTAHGMRNTCKEHPATKPRASATVNASLKAVGGPRRAQREEKHCIPKRTGAGATTSMLLKQMNPIDLHHLNFSKSIYSRFIPPASKRCENVSKWIK